MNKFFSFPAMFFWLAFICTQSATADTIVRSRTERTSTLGITKGGTPFVPTSIYHACAYLKTNQYVEVKFQAELTNPYSKTVGLGRSVLREHGYPGTYVDITLPVMDNVTPDLHHKVIIGNGIDDKIPKDGNYCYYLRAWAASDHSGVYGGNLIVEKGYGELILIIRNK